MPPVFKLPRNIKKAENTLEKKLVSMNKIMDLVGDSAESLSDPLKKQIKHLQTQKTSYENRLDTLRKVSEINTVINKSTKQIGTVSQVIKEGLVDAAKAFKNLGTGILGMVDDVMDTFFGPLWQFTKNLVSGTAKFGMKLFKAAFGIGREKMGASEEQVSLLKAVKDELIKQTQMSEAQLAHARGQGKWTKENAEVTRERNWELWKRLGKWFGDLKDRLKRSFFGRILGGLFRAIAGFISLVLIKPLKFLFGTFLLKPLKWLLATRLVKFFRGIPKMFAKMFSKIPFIGKLSKMGKGARFAGKALGKLAFPLLIIDIVLSFIGDFVRGFKKRGAKGGIVTAITGRMKGKVTSLWGNVGKWASVGAAIGMPFGVIIGGSIGGAIGAIFGAILYWIGYQKMEFVVNKIGGFFKGLFNSAILPLINWGKGIGQKLLEDPWGLMKEAFEYFIDIRSDKNIFRRAIAKLIEWSLTWNPHEWISKFVEETVIPGIKEWFTNMWFKMKEALLGTDIEGKKRLDPKTMGRGRGRIIPKPPAAYIDVSKIQKGPLQPAALTMVEMLESLRGRTFAIPSKQEGGEAKETGLVTVHEGEQIRPASFSRFEAELLKKVGKEIIDSLKEVKNQITAGGRGRPGELFTIAGVRGIDDLGLLLINSLVL